MAVRTIHPRTSLGSVLAEITYTHSRLKAHPLGAPHVAAFEALRAEWPAVHNKELVVRDAITDAQALIDHVDDLLDNLANGVVHAILTITNGDRTHALYKHFLGNKTPSDFKRPVLGGQLEAMKAWLPALEQSEHAPLVAFAPALAGLLGQASSAVTAKAEAEGARDQFRDFGERKKFIDKLNGCRKETHGALARLPHEHSSLPRNFADKFFRRERVEPGDEADVTITSVKANIVEMQKELAAQHKLLADLEAEEAKVAEAAIHADKEALVVLEAQAAEAQAKAAALRAKIEAK
ncbi:hypothetical protein [Polyangium fumosum]|uniref:Uncharacterized protein n=1 Tax=Polyangium fumosum TaxID=889272 RepID=A0A4U1J0S6_9BACT|nr:hypothetical protein [Polyangium fumosum]TKD00512.1 hypothetical protein E8A74_33945 [Polyangium fumosum]